MHWSSKAPKKIKRNIINNDLHRGEKISTEFNEEIKEIKRKYEFADYPRRFVDSIINDFNRKKREPPKTNVTNKEVLKQFVPIKIPFCDKNEKIARHFLTKLNDYTGEKFTFTIIWQTRKVKTLFSLKDKIKYKANVVYRATVESNPEISYIGETKMIAEKRWEQHQDLTHDSAPSKYLRNNAGKIFSWEILSMSSLDSNKRKIHEALFISKYKPSLNKQVKHKNLLLFKNGVT